MSAFQSVFCGEPGVDAFLNITVEYKCFMFV